VIFGIGNYRTWRSDGGEPAAEHFPFAFSAAIRTPNFPISLRKSLHAGPGGSIRAVSSSFAAIASSCRISVSVPSAVTLTTPARGLLLLVGFILTSFEAPQQRLRLLAGNSETNRELVLTFRFQPDLDQTADGFNH
jgi:hypothetical protein